MSNLRALLLAHSLPMSKAMPLTIISSLVCAYAGMYVAPVRDAPKSTKFPYHETYTSFCAKYFDKSVSQTQSSMTEYFFQLVTAKERPATIMPSRALGTYKRPVVSKYFLYGMPALVVFGALYLNHLKVERLIEERTKEQKYGDLYRAYRFWKKERKAKEEAL